MTAYGTWFESCMARYIGDILWDRLPGLTDHHNRQETVIVSKDIIIWNIYASAFPYFLHALRTTINFLIWPALHWILTGIMLLYNSTMNKRRLHLQHTCQKDDVVNLTRRARSEYLVLHGGIRLDSWMRAWVHRLSLGAFNRRKQHFERRL